MNRLIEKDTPGSNDVPLGVSDISSAIKRSLEGQFSHVRIRGEISGYRGPHTSGHVYFSLKDEKSRLDAVIWKGVFPALRLTLAEGMEVIATGKISSFSGKSGYQLIVEHMTLAGVGALMQLLEVRRKKLAQEGIFDLQRKRKLPAFPKVIGVITSPSGAVIRDILHRLSARFPCQVLLWPAAMQGDKCVTEVVAAIQGFNTLPLGGGIPIPDLLIVARGGGSIEDLWGFNEEEVVRAVACSRIPIISAVGHETDTTLIDFAADVRAPTPTAAAEIAVPEMATLSADLAELEERLHRGASQHVAFLLQILRGLCRAIPAAESLLAENQQRLDHLGESLPRAVQGIFLAKKEFFARVGRHLVPRLLLERIDSLRLSLQGHTQKQETILKYVIFVRRKESDALSARLMLRYLHQSLEQKQMQLHTLTLQGLRWMRSQIEGRQDQLTAMGHLVKTLGYPSVLERGYALVRGVDGRAISSEKMAQGKKKLQIEFADGCINVIVEPPHLQGKKSRPKAKQQDLF